MHELKNIRSKLIEGYIRDLSKPQIDKFERAIALKKHMADNTLSFNDMYNLYGFKKGTLSGWLKWGQLSKKEYQKMKDKGATETAITNMLKGSLESEKSISNETQILNLVDSLEELFKKNSIKYNHKMIQRFDDLIKELNRIIFRFEKRM